MREGQSLNLTNERNRGRRDEAVEPNPECSMRLEVCLRMGQIPESCNGNGGFRLSGNLNRSNNNKLLGLEFISRLHRRTRGLRRLRKIHGVDLANRTLDICPRRIIKTEIIEWSERIPEGKMNQPEKVARDENKVVIEEEKGVNSLARVKRMNLSKQKRFRPRNNRTRRKLSTGKRTVFSWMISVKTMKSRERVYYRDNKSKAVLLGGDAVGDGILCDCCSQVVSISEFEFHSWKQENFNSVDKISDPLRNICLGRGKGLCLLQCMAEAWSKQTDFSSKFYNLVVREDNEKTDDICRVCGERGNLLCCDGCPSTFHQSCLGIQAIPEGEWRCMSCCCKFCGLQCGKTEINFEGLAPFDMSTECLVCERRFHQSCLKANGGNSSLNNKRLPLCGNGCMEIYERLQRLLRVKHDIEDGFSWSFIYRADTDPDITILDTEKVECNAKLGVALSVLSESFMPYIEEGSGTNIIQSIVYSSGSNIPRLDCKGFITVILEKDYEIISVASIRIHGNLLAEMPFVATVFAYRKKGMFARLLKVIESTLSHLNVELLVVPTVKQTKETWVRSFGFEPLDLRTENIIKGVNLMVCRGTEKLQKKIPKLT